jgi:hypothetical protein
MGEMRQYLYLVKNKVYALKGTILHSLSQPRMFKVYYSFRPPVKFYVSLVINKNKQTIL